VAGRERRAGGVGRGGGDRGARSRGGRGRGGRRAGGEGEKKGGGGVWKGRAARGGGARREKAARGRGAGGGGARGARAEPGRGEGEAEGGRGGGERERGAGGGGGKGGGGGAQGAGAGGGRGRPTFAHLGRRDRGGGWLSGGRARGDGRAGRGRARGRETGCWAVTDRDRRVSIGWQTNSSEGVPADMALARAPARCRRNGGKVQIPSSENPTEIKQRSRNEPRGPAATRRRPSQKSQITPSLLAGRDFALPLLARRPPDVHHTTDHHSSPVTEAFFDLDHPLAASTGGTASHRAAAETTGPGPSPPAVYEAVSTSPGSLRQTSACCTVSMWTAVLGRPPARPAAFFHVAARAGASGGRSPP